MIRLLKYFKNIDPSNTQLIELHKKLRDLKEKIQILGNQRKYWQERIQVLQKEDRDLKEKIQIFRKESRDLQEKIQILGNQRIDLQEEIDYGGYPTFEASDFDTPTPTDYDASTFFKPIDFD